MLLSFSVPAMLPYIRAGLRQRAGEDVGDERVKRQTIRGLGPRNTKLLAERRMDRTISTDLHIWWKSRTRARERLGTVDFPKLFPIDIWHTFIQPMNAPSYQVIRIDGPCGWRDGDATLFWSEGDEPGGRFEREAYADGFDTPQAFRDFFVPNMGDRFDGVLFKW
jgi:hypothetical protein